MQDFDSVYDLTVGERDGVDSNVLRPLLQAVYCESIRELVDRSSLKEALLALARFLTSPYGRTSNYCWAVDLFFEDVDDTWRPRTVHLSDDFREVLDEFCFLHGAVEQPDYHTTPEQLLAMIEGIAVED